MCCCCCCSLVAAKYLPCVCCCIFWTRVVALGTDWSCVVVVAPVVFLHTPPYRLLDGVCVRARSFHFVLSWCLRMSFFLNMLLLLSCFIDFARAQNLFGPVFDSLRLGRWVHMWFCFSLCVRVCVHFGMSFLRFLLHVPVSSTHRHTLKSCLTVLFFGGFFWLYCVCFCCDFCCGTLNS